MFKWYWVLRYRILIVLCAVHYDDDVEHTMCTQIVYIRLISVHCTLY